MPQLYNGVAASNGSDFVGAFLGENTCRAPSAARRGMRYWGLVSFAANESKVASYSTVAQPFVPGPLPSPGIVFYQMALDSNGDFYICGGFWQASVTVTTMTGMTMLTNSDAESCLADILYKVNGATGAIEWANTLTAGGGVRKRTWQQ